MRPNALCAGEFRVPNDFDTPLPEESSPKLKADENTAGYLHISLAVCVKFLRVLSKRASTFSYGLKSQWLLLLAATPHCGTSPGTSTCLPPSCHHPRTIQEIYLSVISVWEIIINASSVSCFYPQPPVIYLPEQRKSID